MKVSQERLPHSPRPIQATTRTQHTSAAASGSDVADRLPGPAHDSAEDHGSPLPLQARRRVKPTLADRSSDYAENPHQHSGGHDAHGRKWEGEQHASGYVPAYSSVQGHQEPDGAQSRNALAYSSPLDQQGPYRIVVVFLLLLMALVIMGIVYQLFLRPESATSNLAQQNLAQQNVVPAESGTSDNQKPGSESDMGNRANPADGTPEDQSEGRPGSTLSRSSSVSTITPRGEELSPPPSASAGNDSLPVGPSVQSDENDLLLQSKVGGIGYWIQVGAFSSLNNANSIKGRLSARHIESVIQSGRHDGATIYRVRVGLYTSKEEAERILRQLKNIGESFINSMIIEAEI